jgi:hypothetical protein
VSPWTLAQRERDKAVDVLLRGRLVVAGTVVNRAARRSGSARVRPWLRKPVKREARPKP